VPAGGPAAAHARRGSAAAAPRPPPPPPHTPPRRWRGRRQTAHASRPAARGPGGARTRRPHRERCRGGERRSAAPGGGGGGAPAEPRWRSRSGCPDRRARGCGRGAAWPPRRPPAGGGGKRRRGSRRAPPPPVSHAGRPRRAACVTGRRGAPRCSPQAGRGADATACAAPLAVGTAARWRRVCRDARQETVVGCHATAVAVTPRAGCAGGGEENSTLARRHRTHCRRWGAQVVQFIPMEPI